MVATTVSQLAYCLLANTPDLKITLLTLHCIRIHDLQSGDFQAHGVSFIFENKNGG